MLQVVAKTACMALCTAVNLESFDLEVENGTSSSSRVAQASLRHLVPLGLSVAFSAAVQVLERATGLQGSHLSGRALRPRTQRRIGGSCPGLESLKVIILAAASEGTDTANSSQSRLAVRIVSALFGPLQGQCAQKGAATSALPVHPQS